MGRLVRRGVGLVVVLVLSSAPVWAASGTPPSQFRGLDWGTASTSGLRLERAAGAQQTYGNARHDFRPFFGIAVADEEYLFTGGRLTSGQVTIRGEQGFVKLRAELTRRFGHPATPQADLFRWEWTSPPRPSRARGTAAAASPMPPTQARPTARAPRPVPPRPAPTVPSTSPPLYHTDSGVYPTDRLG